MYKFDVENEFSQINREDKYVKTIISQMRILFVSKSIEDAPSSFVESQGKSLMSLNVEIEFFLIPNGGVIGYLKSFPSLMNKIKEFKPHLIHAHYGFCGLLSNIQRRIPVITTYHGSDINYRNNRVLSKISIFLSAFNIFVSEKQKNLVKPKINFTVLPCGINIKTFYPIDKLEARNKMNLDHKIKLILFSNYFSTKTKNAILAQNAVGQIKNANLIELKGYTPTEVCLLLNACDVALMTSFTEGSPLFIKEAMACNRPIVSTNVGDVKELIQDIEGCFITSYDLDDVKKKVINASKFDKVVNARIKVLKYDEHEIAKEIKTIYEKVYKV